MSIYKAHAPGSLMLLGEYAVLDNFPALVCAIDKRITVTLAPHDNENIEIHSNLGFYRTTIKNIEIAAPFSFVLSAFQLFKKHLKTGCKINIESEFSHQVGFASSAAVTVATLAALTNWLGLHYSLLEYILLARNIIQSIQGLGSGADVAACTLGGVIAYRMEPLSAERIHHDLPLTVIYSGSKTLTVQAIQQVKNTFVKHAHLYKKLMQAIGECAAEGWVAVEKKDDDGLGKMMRVQQGLMQALGVSTPVLHNIVEMLNATPNVLGAKISGSGLGDCVIALGKVNEDFSLPLGERIPVSVATQGVICEKI